MKYKIMHVFILVAVLLALTPPTDAPAQASQMVRIGLAAPIRQLDPLRAQSNTSEALIDDQLFLGLTGLDPKGNVQPELAAKWEVSPDGLTWVFVLRQDAQWVDVNGKPQRSVNAGDAATGLNRARDAGFLGDLIASITVVDDQTLQITLNRPNDSLLAGLALLPAAKPVPNDMVKLSGDAWGQTADQLWTDGSYLLKTWTDSQVELEANPLWPDAANAQVHKARLEYVGDPTLMIQHYLGGDLDLVELTANSLPIAQRDPRLQPDLHGGFNNKLGIAVLVAPRQGAGSFGYLVKPYVQPVYVVFLGLGSLEQWTLTNYDPNVLIPDTTRVLDEETLNALQFMSADQTELVFDHMTPQLSVLQSGDILVGTSLLGRANENVAPYGLLRKVVSTSSNGAGQFFVETVQAALDEAIERGSQNLTVPLNFNNVYKTVPLVSMTPTQPSVRLVSYRPAADGMQVTFDRVVYDADEDPATLYDQVRATGWVNLAPEMQFTFSVDINDHQLQSFSFTHTMQESSHIELSSTVDILNFGGTIPIKRFIFVPQVIFIGWVPIVVTPELTINAGANGNISVNASASIAQNATLTAGAQYQNGSWEYLGNISDNQITPLQTELTHSITAGAFAGPEASLTIYGVAGPYGSIKNYLNARADLTPAPWWQLFGGVKAELGIRVEVLTHVVASYTRDFDIIPEQLLAQSVAAPTPEPTAVPTEVGPVPTSSPPSDDGILTCSSQWWSLRCWPGWLWVIAVIIVILIIVGLIGR